MIKSILNNNVTKIDYSKTKIDIKIKKIYKSIKSEDAVSNRNKNKINLYV